jgi:type III secretion protein C
MKLPWKSRVVALWLALWLPAAGALAAPPAPWSEAPFSHYAENTPLDKVLGDFAAGFSLRLELGDEVSGTVNGRFNARSPSEFIDRLGGVYGFVWYVRQGTLHVVRANQVVSRALAVPPGSLASLRKALTEMGVIEPRFGWGELPEQGVVLVSGPPQYVATIEQTLALLPRSPGGQQVAVYRLRHASVDDRRILYRDREITTPGLATVLRNLISGQGGAPSETLAAIAAPLRGITGDASPAAAPATAAAAPRPVNLQQARAPSLQADSRLNALIVQDVPERLPVYEKLIAMLDVPTALIEIEALIIDINAQRLEELGIAWGGRSGGVAFGFGNPSTALASGALSLVSGGKTVTPATVSVDTGNYLVARIRALESKGDAQIQSRPSILTVDNVGALIDLSETFYIRTAGERVATVTPVTVGTTLRVTPRVVEQGAGQGRVVKLVVDIEDGAIQDRTVDTLPTVRRSVVNTQALVNEDATLLIGGYRTDQKVSNNERVPVLGAIPLLGALFNTRTADVQQRERLFMIRPRIVTLPAAPTTTPTPPAPVAPAG